MADSIDDILGLDEDIDAENDVGASDNPFNRPVASGREAQLWQKPMSATFLATLMGMNPRTVQRLLTNCPPIGKNRRAPIYDFRQAMTYLVKPSTDDIREIIKKIGVKDLPLDLQSEVWDARLKEQKWRENAQELWRSDDVIEVISGFFKTIHNSMRLWPDQIADELNLPDDARVELERMVRALGDSMLEQLRTLEDRQQTLPQSEDYPNVAT